MTQPETAATIADAEHEARAAQDLADALAERVRDGDQDVTPGQLAEQRELASFAQLRLEAARRKETRIREEERAALGAAARDAAEQLITGPGTGEIAAAMRTAVDALAELAALVHARNAQVAEIGTTLVQLDGDLQRAGAVTGPWGSRRYGVWGDRGRVAWTA